jgi:hypothetical protein
MYALERNAWKFEDRDQRTEKIKDHKINTWAEVHEFYGHAGDDYEKNKLIHAYSSLCEIENITSRQFTPEYFAQLSERALKTKTWMSKGIYESRAKDYTNPFRKMVYESKDEMDVVIGKIEGNHFIQEQFKELENFKKTVKGLVKKFGKS